MSRCFVFPHIKEQSDHKVDYARLAGHESLGRCGDNAELDPDFALGYVTLIGTLGPLLRPICTL